MGEVAKLPEAISSEIAKHNVDMTKAEAIASAYVPFMSESQELASELKVLTKGVETDVPKAKEIRIKLGHIASRVEEQKKKDKADLLIQTRFIDGLFNTVNGYCRLTQSEAKEIEDHFKNLELARIAKIQEEREAELAKYDMAGFPSLGEMTEEVWNNFIAGTKSNYELKVAAEKKAEEERIEQERLNALRSERRLIIAPYGKYADGDEFGDLAMKSEDEFNDIISILEKREAKYIDEQEKVKAEKERIEKELAAEREKVKAAEAEAEKVRQEAAKKEAEQAARLKAEAEAAAKAEAERLAAQEAARKAPIAEQLKVWVNGFSIEDAPVSDGPAIEIQAKFEGFKRWAIQQVEAYSSKTN